MQISTHYDVISRWLQASLAAINEAGPRTCRMEDAGNPCLMGDGQTLAVQSVWGAVLTAKAWRPQVLLSTMLLVRICHQLYQCSRGAGRLSAD